MRRWTPVVRFDREGIEPSAIGFPTRVPATPLEPPVAPVERIGGLPVGFPADRWPVCEEWLSWSDDGDCLPMSFLAQFAHDPERCDLGREGRWLFVFGCFRDGIHSVWDPDAGANACAIVEPEDLVTGETIVDGLLREDPSNPSDWYVGRSFRVVGWVEDDDGFTAEEHEAFRLYGHGGTDPGLVQRWLDLGATAWGTALGGTPGYCQSSASWPRSPWKYLGSLGEVIVRDDPPPVFVHGPPLPGSEPAVVAADGSWKTRPVLDGFMFGIWVDTSDPHDPRAQLIGWH